MGLIKAAVGAVGSTLHDQWKDAIRCENMPNDVLMVRKTTDTGVISNGSTVIVAPGQCAIIYDNGKILDATAEDGIYTFDTSSTPSLFAGQFGGMFKEMWQRFTYNGATSKEQAVYFFNLKEILDNRFGTPVPVPYQDYSHAIPNQMTGVISPMRVSVKCFGKYTFKIADPFLFMKEIAGTAAICKKADLTEQMRSEVISAFQKVLNELGNSEHKVPVLELPSQKDEIKKLMDENVFDEPIRKRGISLSSFTIESVTPDEESQKKIDNYELSSNSMMQQGALVGAYANAVQDAANNANGATNGFMGIGMMNMATGGVMGGAVQGPWQNNQAPQSQQPVQQQQTDAPQVVASEQVTQSGWTCPNCNKQVNGKFCSDCGAKKPEKLKCPKCGVELDEKKKFCPECGTDLQNV